jgi:hypothetical protein
MHARWGFAPGRVGENHVALQSMQERPLRASAARPYPSSRDCHGERVKLGLGASHSDAHYAMMNQLEPRHVSCRGSFLLEPRYKLGHLKPVG